MAIITDYHEYRPEHVYYSNKIGDSITIIRDCEFGGRPARLYEENGVRESACYFGEDKYELPFDYMKSFSRLTDMIGEDADVLLIGGAGFTYPKYFISHFPHRTMDVVEMNHEAVALARRFFFLNDLETDFQAFSSGRLHIYEDEAIHYMTRSKKLYDLIINDAYHCDSPDMELYSDHGLSQFHSHLKPGGILGANLITALAGSDSMRGTMVTSMLSTRFDEVSISPCSTDLDPLQKQNCLIIAT